MMYLQTPMYLHLATCLVYLAERCQSAGGNCQLAFAILPARRAGQIWQTYKRLMAIFGMVWREAPVMRANIRRL